VHYGYLDARVSWELRRSHDASAANVVFVIEEGPRSKVDRVELSGVNEFHEREVSKPLLAQPKRPYDPAFLAIDTLSISRLYQERGFLPTTQASAERGQPDSVAVRVRYDVHEGSRYSIGTIDYEGTGLLKEKLARRELLFKTGDVFRRSRLEQSVERLYDTGLYSQVQVSTFTDTAAATLDLLLRVAERKPRWVDVGIGAGSVDMFRFVGTWGHRNVDQNALLGSLDGLLAVDRQRQDPSTEAQVVKVRQGRASANLVEPWLFGVRLQGQVSLYYEEASDDRDPRFLQLRDARGLEGGMLREFSRIFRASVTARTSLVHQSYVIFLEADEATRDSLSQVLQRYWDNGMALSLSRDTRNDRITPNRGFHPDAGGRNGGRTAQGGQQLPEAAAGLELVLPRRNGWGLAARLSGGAMTPTGEATEDFAPGTQDEDVARVPKERRFFLGGVNSLRGFGENAIPPDGGLAMMLANLEYRIPCGVRSGPRCSWTWGMSGPGRSTSKAADFVAPLERPAGPARGYPLDLRGRGTPPATFRAAETGHLLERAPGVPRLTGVRRAAPVCLPVRHRPELLTHVRRRRSPPTRRRPRPQGVVETLREEIEEAVEHVPQPVRWTVGKLTRLGLLVAAGPARAGAGERDPVLHEPHRAGGARAVAALESHAARAQRPGARVARHPRQSVHGLSRGRAARALSRRRHAARGQGDARGLLRVGAVARASRSDRRDARTAPGAAHRGQRHAATAGVAL
jgi:hypothetical protein